MKKNSKFVVGLMSVALLAIPALVACGGGSNSNGESSTQQSNGGNSSGEQYEQVKTGLIEAPDYVVVGDEFNLDDYVTIEGGAGPKVFKATVNTVSEGVVKIDGHKVTVLTEGTISIKITVGPDGEEPLWSGKFATKSISTMQASFHEATKDITKQFMFYEIEEDARTGEIYAAPSVRHTAEYLWIDRWDVEDERLGTYASGGIMRCGNGHTHFYSIDSKETTITVDAERRADYDLYYISQDFALNYTSLETMVDVDEESGEKFEYLIGYAQNDESVTSFVEYNMTLMWNERYTTHSIECYPITPFDDGKTYWEFDVYVAYSAAPTVRVAYAGSYFLSTEDDDCRVPLVEEYIKNKSEPAEIAFDDITAKFDAIAAAKNYTMTTSTSFVYEDPTTGNEITVVGDEYDQSAWGLYNGGVQTTTVNEDSVVSTFKHGDDTELVGAYEEGGKVYTYVGAGDKFSVEEDKATSALWGNDSYLTAACLKSTNNNVYKDFRVNNKTENKDGSVTYKLDGANCVNFIDALLNLSEAGSGVSALVARMSENYVKELDGKSFYSQLDNYLTIADDYVLFTVNLGWTDDTIGGVKVDIDAKIEVKIYNIGTTAANTVPAGAKA